MRRRKDIDKLIFNYFTRALQGIGWAPELNQSFTLEQLITQLGIMKEHQNYVGRFMEILISNGLLQQQSNGNEFKVKRLPTEKEAYTSEIKSILQKHCCSPDPENSKKAAETPVDEVPFAFLQLVGENLEKILTGKESPLSILFPKDEDQISASKYYDYLFARPKTVVFPLLLKQWQGLKASYSERNLEMPALRLIEIGAGTGGFTELFLKSLEQAGIPFQYTYTDISAAFFATAEKRFDKFGKSMKFHKLDIEKDPSTQGLPLHHFDIVIAAHVIHATRDIRESLINCRQLLKDGGNLCLTENIGEDNLLDWIFGLLEGFWRFSDFELRDNNHAMLPIKKWEQVLKETGFSDASHNKINFDTFLMGRADKDGDEMSSYRQLCKRLNKNMQQGHSETAPFWLVFYREEEHEFVQCLKKSFDNLGRKSVIFVKQSEESDSEFNFDLTGENFKINPNSKADMDKIFSLLFGQKRKSVEGIIVTWGLFGIGRDQSLMAQPFLYLLQNLATLPKKFQPKCFLVTKDQYSIGDTFCENPSASSLIGMARSFINENKDVRLRGIDISSFEEGSKQILEEIFGAVDFDNQDEQPPFFCAYRNGARLTPKLVQDRMNSKSLPLSSIVSERFQLVHSHLKTIQDLEFGELEQKPLKPNEIEVKVKCSALNFKDILNILKPTEEFSNANGIGFDISGEVTRVGEAVTKWKVGDLVCGSNTENLEPMPSHVNINEDLVVDFPSSMTFSEAAGFTTVFATVYDSLVTKAEAKMGETVLIHTGSGGVGLVAIQLAKYFGLDIICTAGTARKRAYLKSLGIRHVLNSRDTSFSEAIMKVTNGRGVDIALNTLTGPGFKEATLEACGKNSRFVELSKVNIWKGGEDITKIHPHVKYFLVDVHHKDFNMKKCLEAMKEYFMRGILQPIPITRFDAVDIKEALGYLQKAQHIGKVVITMPQFQKGENRRRVIPLFNDRATYLITGALGGIGLEVCKWMVKQGASHIVLNGRSPPSSATTKVLEGLKMAYPNSNLRVMLGDVGDFEVCRRIINKISESETLPPLKGIMHSAGTLSDGVVENQTWGKFLHTYRSKVDGSWNLHDLTKHLVLEHFVLFSSMAATLGSGGQANHASACGFEDGLVHYRNSQGLTATTINWGHWGEVGHTGDIEVFLVRSFTAEQGINALDEIVRKNRNNCVVGTMKDNAKEECQFLPFTKWLLDETILKSGGKKDNSQRKTLSLSSEQFWSDYDKNGEEKKEVAKLYIKTIIAHVLRIKMDSFDENGNLLEMGLDSLMSMELQNYLQALCKPRVSLSRSVVRDATSVTVLAKRLVEFIEGGEEIAAAAAPSTLEEIKEMMVKDSQLPVDIVPEALGSEVLPSQIKRILLTGATGRVGAHILNELLIGQQHAHVEKVYCLVRGKSPMERLTTALKNNLLMEGIKEQLNKVEIISGDLTEPHFGIKNEEDYLQLSSDVDAILHFGGKVNHTEYYEVIPNGKSDGRSVNVGGILNILEFACKTKTKHVLFPSSIYGVHDISDKDKVFPEAWPNLDNCKPFTNGGYFVTKVVSELLLKEATEGRGIPCKCFRFPNLRGAISTGKSSVESSHLMKTFMFLMKEGVMPSEGYPVCLAPVDIASKMALKIFFMDEAPNSVFNVIHPKVQNLQDFFPKVAEELGYSIEEMEMSWQDSRQIIFDKLKAKNEGGGESVGEHYRTISQYYNFYEDDKLFMSMFNITSLAKYGVNHDNNNKNDFFLSEKLAKFVPEMYFGLESSYEILRRDYLNAKEEGLFELL